MKKYKTFIGIFVILVSTHLACTEKILDKSPLDKYSDATVWVDVNLCSNYLNYCYNKAQIGQFRNVMIGAVSDEMHVSRGSNSTPYNIGTMTADNTNGAYGNPWYPNSSWAQFANIQRLNLFLDKIDNVANAYSESQRSGVKEKTDILKGEALFLRGFIYTEMCRTYGGVPILSKANKL
ncbi:MAG: RagB/SusD family nutrient uptake outer membrane protein, partial [Methanococcaceae archaeon]